MRLAPEQEHAKGRPFGVDYDRIKDYGVSKDLKKAVMWFTKAAQQEHSEAQYELGICYANGNGVSTDLKAAAKWIKKAYDKGHEGAKAFWYTFELGKYPIREDK